MKIFLTVLCIVVITSSASAAPQYSSECSDPNTEYLECGSACPLTCRNMNRNFMCITVCRSGCFCRKGLVRNEDNKCIEPSHCLIPMHS
uniref:Putative til domain-containing cysteine-rich salivary secreted peptide n=1 Tax=Aedes albopictus TaxID=7160 RepID=A0A1W7R7M7_AEDAL